MANATLMEFFSQYNKDIPASVQPGVIEEIRYDKEMRGDISVVELERWAQLVQIEGESMITETCLEAVVSKATPDPDTIAEIMDGCVAPTMASISSAV